MDSIKKVSIGEIKAHKEELLKSMKGLVHTAKDIFDSTPFKDEDIAVGTDHILTIEVGGNTYPVHYTPNTMTMIDGDLSITDYIFDEENYLSLSDDDDMMWFSLVMQLGHQIDLLQNENNQYREDLTTADNEINELETKLKDKDERINQLSKNNATLSAENKNISEMIKNADRDVRFYAREVDNLEKQIKDLQSKALLVAEKASDPDDIISRMETAYTKRTIELLGKITELENDNKRLSERVKTLVIEKSKLEKSDDDRTEKPASEIIKECVGDSSDLTEKLDAVKMDLETATLLQENAKLKEGVQALKDSLRERISEYDRRLSVLKKQKEEAELIAYRFLRADYEKRDKE